MKVSITHPADVQEKLKDGYGAIAVYADLMVDIEKKIRWLDQQMEEYDQTLTAKQRGLTVAMDQLRARESAGEQSRELAKQKRDYQDMINSCTQKRQKLRTLREENAVLFRQCQQLHSDANVCAEAWKALVKRCVRIIDEFLRAY